MSAFASSRAEWSSWSSLMIQKERNYDIMIPLNRDENT